MSKRHTHAVLEIDEGRITLTIAEGRGRNLAVRRIIRTELDPNQQNAWRNALGEVLQDARLEGVPVHVALGDRRFIHTRIDLPPMPPDQTRDVASREARQIGSIPADVPMLVGCQYAGRSPDRRLRYGVVALPLSVWTPIQDRLREYALDVASLTSIEAAAASAVDATEGPVALIDPGPARVRFVYCDDGVARQVRRIRVPTWNLEDDDGAMITTQLVMEVPRTLEFLGNQGLPAPREILLGHLLHIDHDVLGSMFEEETPIRTFPAPFVGPEEQGVSIPTCGILKQIRDGKPTSILADSSIKAPRSRLGVAMTAACAVMIAVGIAATLVFLDETEASRQATRTLADRAQDLLDREVVAPIVEDEDPVDERLGRLLRMRRPTSRAIAEVCKVVPEHVTLQSMRVDALHGITLQGYATGTRRESLSRVARFVDRLHEIGFLGEVVETLGNGEQDGLQFVVSSGWRMP